MPSNIKLEYLFSDPENLDATMLPDYTTLDYKGKICIICGNEGKGISKLVKDNCDFIATIPMKGDVNSLNASVATAIIIFEAMKQR